MKEHCLQWTDALDYGTLSSQDSQVLSNLAISLSTVGGSHKRWRYQTRAELHEASCSIHLLSTRVRLNVRALAGISDKAPWFNHRRTLLCCRIIEPINILNMSKHRNLAVLKQLRKWPLYLLWVNSLVDRMLNNHGLNSLQTCSLHSTHYFIGNGICECV